MTLGPQAAWLVDALTRGGAGDVTHTPNTAASSSDCRASCAPKVEAVVAAAAVDWRVKYGFKQPAAGVAGVKSKTGAFEAPTPSAPAAKLLVYAALSY